MKLGVTQVMVMCHTDSDGLSFSRLYLEDGGGLPGINIYAGQPKGLGIIGAIELTVSLFSKLWGFSKISMHLQWDRQC